MRPVCRGCPSQITSCFAYQEGESKQKLNTLNKLLSFILLERLLGPHLEAGSKCFCQQVSEVHSHFVCVCGFRSPASATVSCLRPVSGRSTSPRPVQRFSRSRSSSRWTSPTRRAAAQPRNMASTPSPSRCSQVDTEHTTLV